MKIEVTLPDGTKTNFKLTWAYVSKKKTTETYCYVLNYNHDIVSTGRTYVHKGDVFTKRVGRKQSLVKAINPAIFPDKEVRRQLWEGYAKNVNFKF